MFNGGIRGKRAKDGEGTTSVTDNFIQTISPIPYIRNFRVSEQDDLALDPTGGQTVILNGNGFETGLTLSIGGVSVSPVTVINDQQISFTAPAKASGTYTVLLINPSGGAAILAPGIVYSGFPNFVTAAGNIGNFYETTAVSTSVSATADSNITYEIISGSIPAGTTFNSDGTLTGTAHVDTASTTYTFTVKATDQELQDSTREFSLTINTDVITWIYPQNNATVAISNNQPTINLSATSAAGYGVVYNVSALPAGLTLGENGEITGTLTENSETSATLTATALTTDRIGTISVTWSVQLGDAFFNQITLLLNADTNTFITDASTNAFNITPNGDTRPSAFSPYSMPPNQWSAVWSSANLGATVDAINPGTVPISLEFWLNWGGYIPGAPGGTTAWVWTVGSKAPYGSVMQVVISGGNITFTWGQGGNGGPYINRSTPINTGEWHHYLWIRDGATATLYVDGVSVGNGVGANGWSASSTAMEGTQYFNEPATNFYFAGGFQGFISNFRLITNQVIVSGNFTPSENGLTATDIGHTGPNVAASITGTVQELFFSTNHTWKDQSANNRTPSSVASASASAFSPFPYTDTSTGSGYFDGTGDYLQAASNVAFDVGTGNFTMEFWVYPLAHSALYVSRQSSSSGWENIQWYLSTDSVGTLIMGASTYGGGQNFWAGSTIPLNTWTHIAIVRDSTAPSGWRIFINGTSIAYALGVGLNYSMESTTVGRPLNIGGFPGWGQTTGYIADFRFVPGTVVYTGNFTPPTAPLTATQSAGTNIAAITGTSTSLLTLQNRVSYNNSQPIDESGIRNIITRNGNASAGTFSPHVPTGWSAYFDGTGDYLTTPNNAAFGFGTGDFTVEGWWYFTGTISTYQRPWGFSDDNDNIELNGSVLRVGGGSQGTLITGSTTILPNTWYHIALVRSSGTYKLYLNGTQEGGSASNSYNSSSRQFGIMAYTAGQNPSTGYVSNVRIVKGTAVYTANFTPPTAPLTNIANTSLLTLRGPSFTDDGSNRFAITRNGDTRITPFSPFAPHTRAPLSHSVYFDGNGDYLTGPTGNSTLNTALNINAVATDFTVEFWFKLNDATNANGGTVVTNFTSLGGNGFVIGLTTAYDGSGLYFSSWVNNAQTATKSKSNGGNWDLTGWNHAAIVGNGGNLYFYANGVELGTLFDLSRAITTTGTGTGLGIGAYIQNLGYAGYFPGYISNLRIVKGTAVYTSNFTPPTAPLEPIAGTSLLTCQSSTVVDNSDNAFALTVNGNSQPTQFNPFGETVATGVEYAPASHGGSVYFDGTGDYLTSGTSTAYTLGTGDFTIEAWLYNFGFAGSQYGRGWCTLYQAGGYNTTRLMLRLWNGTDNMNMWLYLNPSVYFGGSGTNSTALITPYSWTHAAFVRQSGTFKLYINGTLDTTISGVTIGLNFDTVEIGRNQDGGTPDWNGYISNLRVVKGTAVYTSAFVPPAAPADPIAGTTLLVNGTNAAIQDRTGRTVLETVGNARTLPESPYRLNKSVYFDGTGDYLTTSSTTLMDVTSSSQTFTIEAWIYPTAINASGPQGYRFTSILSKGLVYLSFGYTSTGVLRWYTYNGAENYINSSAGVIVQNQWQHVAVVSNNGSITLYVNGQSVATGSLVAPNGGTGVSPKIGHADTNFAADALNGYISNIRTATTAIVPPAGGPTAPLTAVSGTSLLTCQSYNFKDNSTNNFTITRNGDARISSRGPFTETETENNAMSFDGTGDWLTCPGSQAWAFGTGNFTIECWFYTTAVSTRGHLVANRNSTDSWELLTYNSKVYFGNGPTDFLIQSDSLSNGTWYHIAVSRSGTSLKLFIDGVEKASATNSSNFSNATNVLGIGALRDTGQYPLNGYIDDLRITKGVARYTANFTAPTNNFGGR